MVESTDLPNPGLSINLETTFSSLLIFEVKVLRSSEDFSRLASVFFNEIAKVSFDDIWESILFLSFSFASKRLI
jgi:hypothetical protein